MGGFNIFNTAWKRNSQIIDINIRRQFDVVNILTKARQDIRKFVTRITAERAADIPQVFEHINIHFDIEGTGIDAKRVQRAIDLTADKYCSASIMMVRAGAQVSHTFTISEPAG